MTKKKSETRELVDQIQINANEKPRTIKMSFGLLNRLCIIAGDAEGCVTMMIEPSMQNRILLEVFAERNEEGQIVIAADLDSYDLSTNDVMILLDWVSEHVLDFFLRALEMAQNLQKRSHNRVENLKSFSTGSLG